MKDTFRKLATKVSLATGSAGAFLLALTIVIVWAITGPMFDFSDTWQLFINTGTTIGTFLMVFLIQNTQNRDSRAMQLKLDELIRATKASDAFIDIEDLNDEELALITSEFRKMHDHNTSPALNKFRKKLEAIHHKRKHQSPSEQAEHIAGQVAHILNPFSAHDDQDSHKK